ncbi:myxosortase-dependent metalloprotease, MXAN_2677/MXAN_2678 family [Cystobacter fuscus]|uniref:myxosortase-dependent metalloprotease, MXAN_2677/MXAN_2678 family n=1 Tax=Cystobacter fuscus TaxID=43 RepID=UPI002B307725|nr:matrixin family metalloprotease [Cystobacter fuscus]
MMVSSALLLSLALAQSSPYVRSHVDKDDSSTQCLFWTTPTITWNLSSVGNPESVDEQKQREFAAIRASVQSWQRIFEDCGNLRFSEGPMLDERQVGYVQKEENHNLILFRSRRCQEVVPATDACWADETCGNLRDCWDSNDSTIALTLTTYDERSGIIYDSDIQLNASGFVFTTVSSPPCTQPIASKTPNCVATDVQNTMTHELGHLIGLDHTWLSSSVMYPQAPSGEISKRVIDSGSRDFVCRTYPKGLPSQSCLTPTLDASSPHDTTFVLGKQAAGCSTTGGAPWLSALAALGWLGWRRRGARS